MEQVQPYVEGMERKAAAQRNADAAGAFNEANISDAEGKPDAGCQPELAAAEAGITSEEAPQSGTALQAVETPQPEMTMNEIERVMANMMSVLKDKNATADALHKRFSRRTDMTVDHCIPFSSDRKYSGVAFKEKGTYLMGAAQFPFPGRKRRPDPPVRCIWKRRPACSGTGPQPEPESGE